MAKILISALGAGRNNRQYTKTKYKIENSIYEESFIGNALSKHFKIDKNIVIGTKKSLWEELYIVASESHNIPVNDSFSLELADKIQEGKINKEDIGKLENLLQNKYKGLIIEYGLNNIELMTNFEILMSITEELNDKDEIFIDITNSFRSLSLYMFIILNYLKSVSNINITISYISYGMFEAKEENNGITPVVNLNLLYEAIEWIKAASDFKKFGNSYELSALLPPKHKESGIKLDDFSNSLNLAYVSDLKKQITILYKAKNEFQKIEGFGKFIIPNVVNDIVNRFKKYFDEKKEYQFLFAIAKLFYEKQLFSSAYIFLHEAIVVYFLEYYDFDEKVLSENENKFNRAKIKSALQNKNFCEDEDFKLLNAKYFRLTQIRNSMAHAIDEKHKSIIKKTNYIGDFEKEFYNPIVAILNKNKEYKMF